MNSTASLALHHQYLLTIPSCFAARTVVRAFSYACPAPWSGKGTTFLPDLNPDFKYL